MDILYILGTGSRWQDNELRYSLRSLKNIQHNRVFLVGEKPSWITNVEYIASADPYESPQRNSMYKIGLALNHISDNFILMNDDFFILKPTEIQPYYKSTLADKRNGCSKGKKNYYEAINNTYKLYPDGLDYALHIPMVFNKEKLKQTIADIEGEKPYLLRSAYGNQWQIGGKQMNDVKIRTATELKKHTGTFLSTSDGLVLYSVFQQYINRLFNKPSKYEIR